MGKPKKFNTDFVMISMVAVVTVVAIISIVTKTNLGFYSGQDLMLQGTDEYGNTLLGEAKGGTSPAPCIDSDGGINYYLFGKACIGTSCQSDSCSRGKLSEKYCYTNSGGKTSIKSASYTCPSGCANGACINPDCKIEDRLIYAGYGETKTYTVNGFDFEITALMIDYSSMTAKFSVNGEVTKELGIGQTETQSSQSSIKVEEITLDDQGYHVKFCFNYPTNNTPSSKYYCEGEGVTDYIRDGETKTYTMYGKDYEVTVVFIRHETHTAKLSINGLLTKELGIGESINMGNGVHVRLYEVMTSDWDGLVTFCLSVEPYPSCVDTDPGSEYLVPAFTSFGFLNKQDYCINSRDIMNLYCSYSGDIEEGEHFFTTVNDQEVHLTYESYSPEQSIVFFKDEDMGDNIVVSIAPDGSGELILQGVYLQFKMKNVGVADSDIDPVNFKAIVGNIETCRLLCQDNACWESWCNDTDGGRNYDVAGTTFGTFGSAQDTCYSPSRVYEYYCGDYLIDDYDYSFFLGPSNYEFQYTSYNPTDRTVTFKQKLGDTLVWSVEPDGKFTVILEGKEYMFRVVNVSMSSSPIYYLNGELVMKEKMECDTGICSNGACTTTPCTDSDGGRNYYVQGTTQGMTPAGYFTNVSDYCVPDPDGMIISTILEEYYCYNNLVYDYRYTCPSGYSCVNGVCTSTTIRETDTCVFGASGNWTNFCYSSKGNCTGYGSCTVGVVGTSGEKVTWSSNCLGHPVSTIDGVNENLYFNCTIH